MWPLLLVPISKKKKNKISQNIEGIKQVDEPRKTASNWNKYIMLTIESDQKYY